MLVSTVATGWGLVARSRYTGCHSDQLLQRLKHAQKILCLESNDATCGRVRLRSIRACAFYANIHTPKAFGSAHRQSRRWRREVSCACSATKKLSEAAATQKAPGDE